MRTRSRLLSIALMAALLILVVTALTPVASGGLARGVAVGDRRLGAQGHPHPGRGDPRPQPGRRLGDQEPVERRRRAGQLRAQRRRCRRGRQELPTRSRRHEVPGLHQRRAAEAELGPDGAVPLAGDPDAELPAGADLRQGKLRLQGRSWSRPRARRSRRRGRYDSKGQAGCRPHQAAGHEGLVLVHLPRRHRHGGADRHLHPLRLHPRALRLAGAPLQEDDLQAGVGPVPELGLHVADGHRPHPLLGRHLLHLALPRHAAPAADHRRSTR